MRLWHVDLIPYLPKSQLLAQWRELNSIYKKRDKHILINYIYDYPKEYLFDYSCVVIKEIYNRHIRIKSCDNFVDYFYSEIDFVARKLIYFVSTNIITEYFFKEHNNEYLTICYYNLKEKYLRGQKDFTKEIWDKLNSFYKSKMRGGINEKYFN